MNLVFLGPAGSGKTTLVWKFGEFLKGENYEIFRVNLDCAVKTLPYIPDFDIRNHFTLESIMHRYSLGPNGAMVKSIELIWRKREEIRNLCKKKEFALIDMPGQLELVIFQERKLSDIFKHDRSVAIFLMPADLIENERDYCFLRLLNLAVKFRIDMPCIYVISKADLIERKWKMRKVSDSLSEGIRNLLGEIEDSQRLIYVSRNGRGFEELFSLVHEAFCTCGDLS